ncbi:hypothetical protein MAR_006837 [Mya arenaria]|uniref:Uncharacterized protein n=1 Tax=Mya arenaria TaxID=6604 RepID=A0ABY7D9N4_MYAAR|nr:hypothetical protein MAR_006837 [Mya arenaria]
MYDGRSLSSPAINRIGTRNIGMDTWTYSQNHDENFAPLTLNVIFMQPVANHQKPMHLPANWKRCPVPF